jgi:DNA-binding IclR family transcriptional regulator
MPAAAPARSGTQSIERAVLLLRELALRGAAGWNPRDLALHCGLDRGTVHRILACLVRERLALQRPADLRYVLGPMNFELGAGLPRHAELQDLARATVRRLARTVPRVVCLAYLRSGDDCVCIARAGSSSYTREGTGIRVGHRAPLLALAGGAAILSALPPSEAQAVIARNRRALAHLGPAHLARSEAVVRFRDRFGCILSDGVLWHGINSVAVAVTQGGRVLGSLALGAGEQDYPLQGLRAVAPTLAEAARSLGEEAEGMAF